MGVTMTKPAPIAVHAEGSVQVAPDRANLTFRVRARENDRNRAVEKVRHALQEVTAVLDHYHVPAERRRTQSVTATEVVDPKTRKRIAYESTAWMSIRLELEDFSHIGELYFAVATRGDIDITGPQWEVSATNEGHLEACRRAAASAGRRAAAFAEGARIPLGRLVRIEEDMIGGRGQQMTFAYGAPGGKPQGPEPQALELAAGVVRVSVSIKALYELGTPSSAGLADTGDGHDDNDLTSTSISTTTSEALRDRSTPR
jgi:uncharacterized protein YggE